jgi:hypothetical protein
MAQKTNRNGLMKASVIVNAATGKDVAQGRTDVIEQTIEPGHQQRLI